MNLFNNVGSVIGLISSAVGLFGAAVLLLRKWLTKVIRDAQHDPRFSELKSYQSQRIADLTKFNDLLVKEKDQQIAYHKAASEARRVALNVKDSQIDELIAGLQTTRKLLETAERAAARNDR